MENSYALIVGGTAGLGSMIAREFTTHGIAPIVMGRSADQHLKGAGLQWPLDITDSDSRDIAVSALIDHDLIDHIDYLVMVAGKGSKGSFFHQSEEEVRQTLRTNDEGPTLFIQRFGKSRLFRTDKAHPFHLAAISSTTSWKKRPDETAYANGKAGLSQGMRGLGRELSAILPGSKTTLIQPGGMKGTNFYANTPDVDTASFMEDGTVAKLIVDHLINQQDSWLEMQIERDANGQAVVSYEPRLPQ